VLIPAATRGGTRGEEYVERMADALATFAAGFAQRADSVHIQCGRTADLRRFRQVEEKRRRSRATSAASH
jgi:hypothetical protein